VTIMIEQNPIWGYGADFWSIASPYRSYIWNYLQWATPHAHNSLLDTWFQLGIVGFAIGVAIVVLCLWRTLRFLHRGMPAAVAIWSVMIIVIVLRGLVETLVVPPGVEMFWISLAFAGLAKAAQQRTEVSDRRLTIVHANIPGENRSRRGRSPKLRYSQRF
jgi:O-antigen ligase